MGISTHGLPIQKALVIRSAEDTVCGRLKRSEANTPSPPTSNPFTEEESTGFGRYWILHLHTQK